MKYTYGEEIVYEYSLIEPGDVEKLQAFSCGNDNLDRYICSEMLREEQVDAEDGLPFKVFDVETEEIIAVFSLAASGIIHRETGYIHVLPAIKIDILAVDVKYQKMHMDSLSEGINAERFYLSDSIMCTIIKHCREISEKWAAAKYIILYADKKAKHFYERNLFSDFSEYMEKEKNMEICENDPMYMMLD